MRRAMATLLHNPTVRMKQLAAEPGGDRYAAALSALFDLDPSLPASVGGSGRRASPGRRWEGPMTRAPRVAAGARRLPPHAACAWRPGAARWPSPSPGSSARSSPRPPAERSSWSR